MDSDDEIDWSIRDLKNAPNLPEDDKFLAALRLRTSSDGLISTQSGHEVRPRLWSTGSISQLPTHTAPSSPFATKQTSSRFGFGANYSKKSLSKLNLGHHQQSPISESRIEDVLHSSAGSLPPAPQLRTRFMLPPEDEEGAQHSQSPSSQPASAYSDSSNEEDDFEADDSYDDEDSDLNDQGVIFMGMKLPTWITKKRPSWNRVAACIVTRAPCFWCFSFHQKTDRAIMERLNILCAFFASGQLASALSLIICLVAPGIVERQLVQPLPDSSLTGETNATSTSSGGNSSTVELLVSIWNTNGSVMMSTYLAKNACQFAFFHLKPYWLFCLCFA